MNHYTFFSTGKCTNDCMICAVKGECGIKMAHIGNTDKQRKGIINILKGAGDTGVCATGGDPLRNPEFLDLMLKYHKGDNTIVLNPITFLCNEFKKPARRITKEEAFPFVRDVKEFELSPKNKRLIDILKDFDGVGYSCGNMQAPNSEVMSAASFFFERFVQPKINKRTWYEKLLRWKGKDKINLKRADGTYAEGGKVGQLRSITCAGSARDMVLDNRVVSDSFMIADNWQWKGFECSYEDYGRLVFRKNEKGMGIRILGCCCPGVTDYNSFETDLTLEELADINPKDVEGIFDSYDKKIKGTMFHRLMNEATYNEPKQVQDVESEVELDTFDYGRGFNRYINAAKDILKERTGNYTDLLVDTFTFNPDGDAKECEICYTASIMMNRAGITPKEWMQYLEDNVTHPNDELKYTKCKLGGN